jgi:hypothetical protein
MAVPGAPAQSAGELSALYAELAQTPEGDPREEELLRQIAALTAGQPAAVAA